MLNNGQQNYIIWTIGYEFPGVSLLIDRMNNVGGRINKNELALFVRRQDVIKLSKDLEPKFFEVSISKIKKRLKKHFNSVELEPLQLQDFLWVLMKAKLSKSLKRIDESADASFQISFSKTIEIIDKLFDKLTEE